MTENLSDLIQDIDIQEAGAEIGLGQVARDVTGIRETNLKTNTLTPLVWFYIISNTILAVGIAGFAIDERVHSSFGSHIITEKVVIALIVGNTVQLAAMIVAAFKGLFNSGDGKTDALRPHSG